jgi:peptide/nickel transport system permease protein
MDLDWLPLRGRIDPNIVLPPTLTGFFLIDSLLAARPDVFFNALRHLVLPVLTLAFGTVATIVRFTRSGVLETLQKDFVAYERAAGYPRPILLWKYVLRNSIISTVTQIGLLFGSLLAGAVVIEAIFDWPGLGGYLVGAILASDYQAVVSTTLVIGLVYAVLNIFVDVAHALIDPRISQQL